MDTPSNDRPPSEKYRYKKGEYIVLNRDRASGLPVAVYKIIGYKSMPIITYEPGYEIQSILAFPADSKVGPRHYEFISETRQSAINSAASKNEVEKEEVKAAKEIDPFTGKPVVREVYSTPTPSNKFLYGTGGRRKRTYRHKKSKRHTRRRR